jgi:predicted nucleotidyltransferase
MVQTNKMVSPSIIDELVKQIIKSAHPVRIILFGSAVTGEMTSESDIDVMVVMPDGTHCLDTTHHLYQQIARFGLPVDLVVTTPRILERHKDNIGLIYRNVLAEGKEVYAA